MTTDISIQGLPSDLQEKLISLSETQTDDERNIAIQEICKAGTGPVSFIDVPPDVTQKSVPWEDFRNDYILKVESGNQFVNKLETIEKKFFETKYGPTLYDMLKKEREIYEEEVVSQIASKYNYISKSALGDPIMYRDSSDIKNSINNQIQLNIALSDLSGSDVSKSLSTSLEYIDKELKNAYGNTYTDLRKVEYRNEEISKIRFWNTSINVIYFIVLIATILILLIERKMTKNMVFVILGIALLPTIVLPFLYKMLVKLIMYLLDKYNPPEHGPKNAFIDENYRAYKKGVYDI